MFFGIVSSCFSAELASYSTFSKLCAWYYLTALPVGMHRRLNLYKVFTSSLMQLRLLCSSIADFEILLALSVQ